MATFKVAHAGFATSTHIRTKPPKAEHTRVANLGPAASLFFKKGPPKGPRRFWVAQVGRLISPITIQPEEPKAHPAVRSDKSQARGKRPPITKSLK